MGAITWGRIGTGLGPTGTAAGIVLGAVGSSAWAYYWDTKSVSYNPNIGLPTAGPFPPSPPFPDFEKYEKAGWLHNQFIGELGRKYGGHMEFNNVNEFVDLIYDDLCVFIANNYEIDITLINSTFPKSLMIKHIQQNKDATEAAKNNEDLISKLLENSTVPTSLFKRQCLDFMNLGNSTFPVSMNAVNEMIQNVHTSNMENSDKEVYLYSLTIMKYSYAFWHQEIEK